MPFIHTTFAPSGALLGCVPTKYLLGDSQNLAVLYHSDKFSVHQIKDGALEQLCEFPVAGTIRHLCVVTLFDPHVRAPTRDVLFIYTEKHDVILLCLSRGVVDNEVKEDGIRVLVLYNQRLETSSVTRDESHLCCSTEAPTLFPHVAFTHSRGDLYFLDVVAALGYAAQRKQLNDLFPAKFVSLAKVRARSGVLRRSFFQANEFDVRSIVFGTSLPDRVPPPGSADSAGTETLAFYVLFADQRGKVHVSEYSFSSCTTQSDRAAPLLLTDGLVDHYQNPLNRRDMLQTNADGTAALLVATASGVFIVGSRLVTFVETGVNASRMGVAAASALASRRGRRYASYTREYPRPLSTLADTLPCDVSCAVKKTNDILASREDACTVTTIFIGFYGGVLLQLDISHPALTATTTADPNHGSSPDFVFTVASIPTTPNAVLALSDSKLLLTSRFGNSVVFDMHTHDSANVVSSHRGPVIAMSVVNEWPSCSIIASVGVGEQGGLSVVRAATHFEPHRSLLVPYKASRVLSAGDILMVQQYPNLSFFELDYTVCSVGSAPAHEPSCPRAKPLLSQGLPDAEVLHLFTRATSSAVLAITDHGLYSAEVRPGSPLQWEERVPLPPSLRGQAFCAVSSSRAELVVIGADRTVVLLDGHDRLSELHHTHPIACLCFTKADGSVLALGDWGGNLSLWDTRSREMMGSLALQCTPRSVVLLGDETLVVGLLDGRVFETTCGTVRGEASVARSFFLFDTPVTLSPLTPLSGTTTTPQRAAALVAPGPIPLLLLHTDTGVEMTGIDTPDALDAVCISQERHLFAFLLDNSAEAVAERVSDSGDEARAAGAAAPATLLQIGVLDDARRVGQSFLSVGQTVTRVRYFPQWELVLFSARRPDRDEIICVPYAYLFQQWNFSRVRQVIDAEFLENERCVFIEPFTPTAEDGTDGKVDFALVGSCFTFPDEQWASSSRLAWYGRRGSGHRIELLSSIDVKGPLQCCAAIPGHPGRLAVGMGGSVVLYSWSAEDQSLITEDSCCTVGMNISRILPLAGLDPDRANLAVLDIRYSVSFLSADPAQGSLRVVCRDRRLNGALDGAVLKTRDLADQDTVCVFDEDGNFSTFICQVKRQQHSTAYSPTTYSLLPGEKYHIGDLATCVECGSFTLAAPEDSDGSGRDSAGMPTLRELLPGVCGSQVLYGTSLGTFGAFLPVTRTTFALVSSLEHGLRASGAAAGRLVLDQRLFRAVQLPTASSDETGSRDCTRGVCDGCFVQHWTRIPEGLQRASLRSAESFLRSTFSDRSPDELNVMLSAERLPTLPFALNDIGHFLHCLKRLS